MTIWVTKWALSRGAIARYDNAEAVVVRGRKGNRNRVRVRSKNGGRILKFWPGEWHPTFGAAVARAESMREHELASFAKQAERVASLKFRESRCE